MKRRGRGSPSDPQAEIARLRARVSRERQSRLQAEAIAEQATRDLYFTVERLEQVNEELRRANDVRDRIVSTTAEQMVLPMASLNQLSSALERRWDDITDRNRRMYVGMINEQSSRASRYVQDLVVISQLGAGGLEPELGSVVLAPVLEGVIERALPAGVECRLSCPPGTAVRADRGHIRRILVSLLDNAVLHGAPPIVIDVTERTSEVAIEVRDHGGGVPADHQERLFEPFTSAHTLTPGDEPHAGIGLAIARHLAELQGGRLDHRPADPGASFTLTLPQA